MTYYLSVSGNGAFGTTAITIPYPINVKYIEFKIQRSANDTTGYLFDMRTVQSVYCANSAAAGYTNFEVDNVNYSPAGTNVSSNLPSDHVADVLVTLTNPTSNSGNMSIGARYASGSSGADFLTFDLHDVKLYDASMNVLQAFDWSANNGSTLPSTTSAGNGTINTTYVSWVDGTGGGTGTTYTASGTAQGQSTVTSTETMIYPDYGESDGISDLTSTEILIFPSSGTTQGNAILSSQEAMLYHASGRLDGQSNVTSSETLISQEPITYSGSGSAQGSSTLTSNEHVILTASGSAQFVSNVSSNETIVLNIPTIYSGSGESQGMSNVTSSETMTYQSSGDSTGYADVSSHESYISKQAIIRKIIIKGSRQLHIALLGSRQLHLQWKGGVEVPVRNQNETINAGYDYYIDVNVSDNTVDLTTTTGVYFETKRGTNIISKAKGSGVTVVDANNLQIKLDATDSQGFTGNFTHKVWCEDQNGDESLLSSGVITFLPN